MAARKDQPFRVGADVSSGVGLFDLHAEGALLHGDDLHTWEGTLAEGAPLPTKVDRSDEWIPQVTAGAEITFKIGDIDTLSLGVEGFYNGLGYDDPDLYPWLFAQGDLQFFYVGKAVRRGLRLPAGARDLAARFVHGLLNLQPVRRDAPCAPRRLLGRAHRARAQCVRAVPPRRPGRVRLLGRAPGYTYVMPTVEVGVGARIDF
jgi:hypothetical protein